MSEVDYWKTANEDLAALKELGESVYVTPRQKAALDRSLFIPRGVTMQHFVEALARFLTVDELQALAGEAAIVWRERRMKGEKDANT